MVRGAGEVAPDDLGAIYTAKARAELEHADRLAPAPLAVASAGDVLAGVVLVVGTPGPEEVAARLALAGPVAEAAAKALAALGFDPENTFAVCSRPEPGIDETARASRLEMTVEAVDPLVVIALDPDAACDLGNAFGVAALAPGSPVTIRGRTLGAVGDLRASLSDERAKRPVWEAFRAIAAAAPEPVRGMLAPGGTPAPRPKAG